MKNLFTIIGIFTVIAVLLLGNFSGCGGLATTLQVDKVDKRVQMLDNRVENFRNEFRIDMDELNIKVDSITNVITLIKLDTDSIKKGQQVIYNIAKKQANKKSFIENLNDLF